MKKILAVLLSVCLALCPSVLAAEPIDIDGSELYFPSRSAHAAVAASSDDIAVPVADVDIELVNSEPVYGDDESCDADDDDEDLTIEEMVKVNRDTDSEIWYHIEPDACPGHDFDEPEPWDVEKPEQGWFVACKNCGYTKTVDYCHEDDVPYGDENEEDAVDDEEDLLTTDIEEPMPEPDELDDEESSEATPDTEAVEVESFPDSAEEAEE